MPLIVNVCRKCKNHDCIVDILRTRTDVSVELVRCQKICHGPVVGLPIAGKMEWFEKVERLREVAALVLVTSKRNNGSIPKPLRKRRLKKRSGRAPR